MHNNPNDPNKSEENQKKNVRKKKRFIHYQLGMILHQNFSYHVLLLGIVNVLVGGIVVGLTSRFYPVVSFQTIESYFIVIILFTLIEVFIKGLMVRYLYRFVLMTFGLMLFLGNILSILDC